MSLRFLALAATALLLAACGAALPGYSPPPIKESKVSKFVPKDSGSMGGDGRYELSESEKARDCKHVTGSMLIIITRLKDPYFRTEQSALSSSAQTTASLFGGSARGADRQAEYARERARLDAYNRLLASKNCRTLDIEAEMAKPAEEPGKRY